MNDFDNALLELLSNMEKEREEQEKYPTHVLYMELVKEIRNSLNRLSKAKKIKVGDTANDKYIKVVAPRTQ